MPWIVGAALVGAIDPSRVRAIAVAAVALFGIPLGVLLVLGCGEREDPDVVLIVVDTLRADHLGTWGYARETSPSLDALARDATRFARAYSVAPWTLPSVASILTGLFPSAHSVEKVVSDLPPGAETVGEILNRNGYATAAVISHELISSKRGFGQGFERFVEEDARGHQYVSSGNVTKNAIELLDALALAQRPFLLFVHYFDPHFDYRRHPEFGFASAGAGRLRGGESFRTLKQLDPLPIDAELRFLRSVYDEEIRFTDAAIGQLLDELRARGLYSTSLIVVTADHGEEFMDHGWLGHSRNLYDSVIHVPLIVKLPGGERRGDVIETPVSLVAIAPTILDVLGLPEQAARMQGESLVPLLRGESSAGPVYSEVDFDQKKRPRIWEQRRSADMRAVVRGRHKLIHDRGTDLYELYDLGRDPGEKHDLTSTMPDLYHELRSELDALSDRAAAIHPVPESTHGLAPDEEERLRQLGYIED